MDNQKRLNILLESASECLMLFGARYRRICRLVNGGSKKASLSFLDKWFDGAKTMYFSYNGKYDFYIGSRFSSPVVSRLQNPGLSLKTKYDSPRALGITDFSVGWFHESNGQYIETAYNFDWGRMHWHR